MDLSKYKNLFPTANTNNQSTKKKLPMAVVDKLADELVEVFDNPLYRRWYCGVIYEFGFDRVHEWRRRASEGKEPAKLFSKYVKDARTFRSLGDK